MAEQTLPTYEQYLKATKFARFRFKYGLFVQILAWITLILLIFFIYNYGEELSRNPLAYAVDKIGLDCRCINLEGQTIIANEEGVKVKTEGFLSINPIELEEVINGSTGYN